MPHCFASNSLPALVPLLSDEELEQLWAAGAAGEQAAGLHPPTVTRWLTAVTRLQRSCASSPEFFSDAARFALDVAGFDAVWIYRRTVSTAGSVWELVATDGARLDEPPHELLQLAAVDQQTYFQNEIDLEDSSPTAWAVSPITDQAGQSLGAVAAVRLNQGMNRRRVIRPLEARLLHLLAESVGLGLGRLEQELIATRNRVLLEQAFSPTLATTIQQHPECLDGQLRTVTMLFVDLCAFTALAECLAPAECYRLLGDVMEQLTAAVTKHQGIVVDYYGDGLLAIWNAPLEQTNHAELACNAGLEMLSSLGQASRKWNTRLGVSVGIHTDEVLVGNAGTSSRIKYGPRGSGVNLTSRVQAATKQLELPLLVTEATQRRLSDRFFTLRACTAHLPGLEKPVELYTIYPTASVMRLRSQLDLYAHALGEFERGNLDQAEELLARLRNLGEAAPARFLAGEITRHRNVAIGRRASDRVSAPPSSIVEINEK